MMQNHPIFNSDVPHRSQKHQQKVRTNRHIQTNQSTFLPRSSMVPNETLTDYCDYKDTCRRKHRNNPQRPRRNCHQLRCRARPRESDRTTPTSPPQELFMQIPPISPQQSRTSFGLGPNDNDVVCFTIFGPKIPKGIVAIQPNSTHQGNLRFCSMVKEHAICSRNISSNKEQKRIARTIAAELQSRGGRFLVWVKESPDLLEHNSNGSWRTVDEDNALNICRYVLLNRIDKMKSKSARHSVEKKLFSFASNKREAIDENDIASRKVYESDYSTNDISSNSSASTILNILSEMDVEDDETDLDLWSSSPGGDDKEKKKFIPRLDPCCWEYKLLFPFSVE